MTVTNMVTPLSIVMYCSSLIFDTQYGKNWVPKELNMQVQKTKGF